MTRRHRKVPVLETKKGFCRVGENLSSNQVCVQLPGNRSHCLVDISGDEKIGDLRKKMAHVLDVKEQNWAIYIPNDNKLKIVEDTKQVSLVNRNNLHFYPKVVIR